MAASPAPRSSGSLASSTSTNSHKGLRRAPVAFNDDSVPVETLVEHLLAAKRSLSSMTLVLRANDITQLARKTHEEVVILNAQSEFLRRALADQVRLLLRVRKGLARTYDGAKREFGHIVHTLDVANEKLDLTMRGLRNTMVESAFRPEGEAPRNLMDFIDEESVNELHEDLKKCLGELQATQQSFDSDLLQFENDIRTLKKHLNIPVVSPSDSTSSQPPIPHILSSLINHSHAMAELLSSLTRHFDLCVTAVRTTEGGAELARLKAAESTQSYHSAATESVSISGVIAAQERSPEEEPLSASDRAEMLKVVVGDSAEVDEVVEELRERLAAMESEFSSLLNQAEHAKKLHVSCVAAFRLLEDVGSRLASYVQSEAEFVERWEAEKCTIDDRLQAMDRLKGFYDSYANAYDTLILEAERRRVVDDKIQAIWRKAKENVDKLVESDRRDREAFNLEVGEHLPTDIWPGMGGPARTWNIVPEDKTTVPTDVDILAVIEKSVVQAARERISQRIGFRT